MPAAELPGLLIGSPLGFMAAVGLLRVLAEDRAVPAALAWSGPIAVIEGLEYEAIRAALSEHMRDRHRAPEFNFLVHATNDSPPAPYEHVRTISPQTFSSAAQSMAGDRRALRFLAGLACDALLNDHGCCVRTSFDFTSGQQKFGQKMRNLAQRLDPGQANNGAQKLSSHIDAALLGGTPENEHSFFWEPSTLKSHARQANAPTDERDAAFPIRVWLGIESMPLHPVCVVAGRAQTIGFRRNEAYVWPQWRGALSLAEVEVLRARPLEALAKVPGVIGMYEAVIGSIGKYRYFQPAARIGSD